MVHSSKDIKTPDKNKWRLNSLLGFNNKTFGKTLVKMRAVGAESYEQLENLLEQNDEDIDALLAEAEIVKSSVLANFKWLKADRVACPQIDGYNFLKSI